MGFAPFSRRVAVPVFGRALLLLLILLLSGCHTGLRPDAGSRAESPQPALLILVSIDGFRTDYLDPGLTPTLAALARDGAWVRKLRPAFPALTFPNHYTLVTGLVPDHHGIIANVMADPELPQHFSPGQRAAVQNPAWWNDAEPIWNSARHAGLRSATMFWPGSEAAINGFHPHYWRPYDAAVTPAERVAQVLAWIDLPAALRPHLITLYFDEVDRAGHVSTPHSALTRQRLQETDAALAQLLHGLGARGLWQRVNLIVLSDHGMAATPREQAVLLDEHLPRGSFELLNRGPFVQLRARPGREAELDAALAKPIAHVQCWRKGELPARFRYGTHRRIMPWVCLGDEGWTIYDRFYLQRNGINPGAHGFDPMLDSMATLLVAHGPDFRSGAVLEEMDNVHVYALLAHLLRIPARPHDGDLRQALPLLRPGLAPSPERLAQPQQAHTPAAQPSGQSSQSRQGSSGSPKAMKSGFTNDGPPL